MLQGEAAAVFILRDYDNGGAMKALELHRCPAQAGLDLHHFPLRLPAANCLHPNPQG